MSKRKISLIIGVMLLVTLLLIWFLYFGNKKAEAPAQSNNQNVGQDTERVPNVTTENEGDAITTAEKENAKKELIDYGKEVFSGDCEKVDYEEKDNPLAATVDSLSDALIDRDGNRGILVFCNKVRFYGKSNDGKWQVLYETKDYMPTVVVTSCKLQNIVALFGKPIVNDGVFGGLDTDEYLAATKSSVATCEEFVNNQ